MEIEIHNEDKYKMKYIFPLSFISLNFRVNFNRNLNEDWDINVFRTAHQEHISRAAKVLVES